MHFASIKSASFPIEQCKKFVHSSKVDLGTIVRFQIIVLSECRDLGYRIWQGGENSPMF